MNSIRTKLLLLLMIPLIVIAAIVSLETFYASRKISGDLNDRTLLAATLTILENVISSDGTLLADATLQTLTESLGDRFFYHVTGPGGAFVTGYSNYPRNPGGESPQLGLPLYFDGIHQGAQVRVVQLSQDLAGRDLNGVTTITAWQRTTKRAELTLSLFARSLMRLAMLVLAAGAIVWFAVAIGLRPLIGLQAAIERRTPYDLNPIRRFMPIELRGIVNSMNELFERVLRSKHNRERFIGDAAHQLRNPIAAIKVQAETALGSKDQEDIHSSLEQILQVANHSTGMINKMLSGATAHSLDLEQEETHDLVPMVEEVTLIAATAAFDKNQEISFSKPDTKHVLFRGNLVLLREALSNLIDNAIHHNEPGTVIEVGLERDEDQIQIFVADSGPSFTQEDFLTLTQPFLTQDDTSAGSGLGLSISKDIAKSHGGYLATFKRTDGGKRISIILPI
ncbi:MAG: sensor histidine kinase [Rhizobiaceae bacterium]